MLVWRELLILLSVSSSRFIIKIKKVLALPAIVSIPSHCGEEDKETYARACTSGYTKLNATGCKLPWLFIVYMDGM